MTAKTDPGLPHRPEVEAQLQPGEAVLAWLTLDLDRRLHYADGLVVLTERRLLAWEAGSWQSWELRPELQLGTREHGGVGALELLDGAGRLAGWSYTIRQSAAAQRLVQKLSTWKDRQAGLPLLDDAPVCPSCGQVIRSADGRCPDCDQVRALVSFTGLWRLARFARAHLGLILLGFFLTLASTAAGLVPPYLTMPLLDQVLIPYQTGTGGDLRLLPWFLAGLIGAALLSWMLDWARLYVLSRASERVSAELRTQTYGHLLRLSVEFFGGKRTGDLMSRIGNDTDRLCNFLSVNLVDFATDILMVVMTSVILLSIDWQLALAALCPFPIIVFLVQLVRRHLLRYYHQASVAWAAMTSVLADTIPGIRVVKAFAQEEREIDRFNQSNARVFQINDRLNRIWAFFGPTITLLTTAGLLIIWAFASYRVSQQLITVGVLTAFLAYIARFYNRSESMIRMVSVTQRAAASAERIFEILDKKPTVPDPVKPVHPGKLQGGIELKEVRFKYGPREVLHGINLAIEPGEMIGLVGPSGAGKSTLINLICRFYDVAGGAILVDGADIRSFPVEEYRRNIGIVLQDPFLFYGTVAENIAYGKPGASRDEVLAAARAARAHDFILKLPDGYDSLVGERGQSLSGGERQRISIARALLIDPRLLILDEATSSVDTETEREIQAALETLIQGRTTIAIAHRLSTLRRADRLVVIEHGQIAEIGRHDELLAREGPYARLHKAQMELFEGHVV